MTTRRQPKKMVVQLAVAAFVALIIGIGAVAMVYMVVTNVSQSSSQVAKEAEEKAKRAEEELARLREAERNRQQTPQATKQVQAVVDISAGELITQSMLAAVDVEGTPNPAVASRVSDVVGKVATAAIVSGEPITSKKLMNSENLLQVKPGMRAMTISLDSIASLDGALLPGAFVDILMTMGAGGKQPAPSGEGASPLTKTLLQNIQVIAVGGQANVAASGAPGAVPAAARGAGGGVTVMLSPQQAEMLALAAEQSKLILTLRNLNDKRRVRVPGADLDRLVTGTGVGDGRLPAAPRAPRNLVFGGEGGIVPVNHSAGGLPEPSAPADAGKAKYSMKIYTGSGSQTVVFD